MTGLQKRQGVRLVATRVATLPAGDHTDPAVRGLQLRVRETATGSSRAWLFRFRWRDEHVRMSIGHVPTMNLAEARARALEMRKAIDDGIDPRQARPKRNPRAVAPSLSAAVVRTGHNVEFLAHEFMERHVRPRRKRPEYAEAIVNRIIAEWRGRDARTIKPREVIELLDGIVAKGAPVMANRVAGILGQMFKFGVHRALVESSPVQLLYRPGGKESPRDRSLADDELKAFLEDPKSATRYDRLAHAMVLLLLTGQRRGELALARWSHVDLKARMWKIPAEHSKTGKANVVPLTDWACDEFRALKALAGRSLFVLPNDAGDAPADAKLLTRGVARCKARFEKLGVEPFKLHDLRRTVRIGLARLKIEPHIAERVLNHAQEKIAGTYDTHDYLDEKRAALEKWAEHLRGLTK